MVLYKDVVEGLLCRLEVYENKEVDILSKMELGGVLEHLVRMCIVEEVEMPTTEALVVF